MSTPSDMEKRIESLETNFGCLVLFLFALAILVGLIYGDRIATLFRLVGP